MKEKRFIPLTRDFMMISLFSNRKHLTYIKHFVKNMSGYDYDGKFKIISRTLPKNNIDERLKEVDLLYELDDRYLEIEINMSSNIYIAKRNLVYASKIYGGNLQKGDNLYKHIQGLTQVNLNNRNVISDKPVSFYYDMDIDKNMLSDNFQIVAIDLDKLNKGCYNTLEKKNYANYIKWAKILNSKSLEELERNVKGTMSKKAEKEFVDTVKELESNRRVIKLDTDLSKWEMEKNTEIEVAREEGLAKGLEQGIEKGTKHGIEQGLKHGLKKGFEQGVNQRNIEIAKKMLRDGIDVEDISQYTDLSVEEIEKINSKRK